MTRRHSKSESYGGKKWRTNCPACPAGLHRTSTDDAVQAARDEGRALKEQAREAAEEIRDGAREAAEDVKEQIHSGATRQKDAAAQQMDGWAHALKTASEDLQNRGQGSAAACVRQAAAGLERASGTVRERSLDDLIGTVEDFARRQPVAFIGGAVAAGFGLARLMKSSADRRRSGVAGPGGGDRMGGGFELMMHSQDRSLKELLTDLTESITTLFRKEIQLVRAETAEKMTQVGGRSERWWVASCWRSRL